ncbi:MAG TPA: DNA recombination protein RmuC [Ignavibacteriaceae bacterium]|nr:DNA recombination protein RmuC [Ignavibacteriaceae bacterium]
MEFVYLVIGLVLGGVIIYFFQKNKSSSQSGKYEERNKIFEENNKKLESELNLERNKRIELNSAYSSLQADYNNLQNKLSEQKEEIEQLQKKFTTEFENLANKIFEEKTHKFSEQSKNNLSEILNPLKEKISDFEKKVEENSKENIRGNASLREQLSMLKEMNLQITQEAKNLTQALKGGTKTQGSWGEFILENILQKSGLVKGREYKIQEVIYSEEGRRFQPDVIVSLPENKSVIIDSKVSLLAYEKCISSEDDIERQLSLKEHITSIRNHIRNLSSKNYQSLYQLESLDFVLLFMPIEPAFALAVQNDAQLFNDAFDKNIVIVSPSTLLATLRTVASIWRAENQNRNALEIARQSGALYDKFQALIADLIDLGKRITTMQRGYEETMKKLYTGKGNLVNSVEKIKRLGANTTKSLPQQLLDRADDDDEDSLNHPEDLFGNNQ